MLAAMRLFSAYLAAAALAACSSSETSDGGSGGAGTSTGGATGGVQNTGGSTGGLAPTGGARASGGAPSIGGSDDTGGKASASGGAPAPSGGQANSGGKSNSGGSPSAGNSSTSGGAPSPNGGAVGGGGSAGSAGSSAGGSGGSGGGSSGAPSTCPPATPLSGGTQVCTNATGNAGSGYTYELWGEGAGKGCMTVHGKDATFSATWTGVEDLLARVGRSFDKTKKHAQIGTITAEFAETKTGSNNLVYIGVYGWTDEPLREFYILDDWGEIKPAGTSSDGSPRDFVGTIEVDGGTYDVWKKTRMNKPAITGDNKTFDQYFSIRQTARQCGRISVSEHFTKWEALGLPLGNLWEAKLLMEAQDSTGTISFTTAKVEVD